jgi:hypothetical protein
MVITGQLRPKICKISSQKTRWAWWFRVMVPATWEVKVSGIVVQPYLKTY